MTHEKGQHPGAVWMKCDLQCHSPRDRAWQAPPTLPGGTPQKENARKAWAADFISECGKRNITLVSITDHHDITFIPYVVEAAVSAGGTVSVFPGIEVTCSDNAQCLVLFDPLTTHQTWSHFLGKLPGITQASADDPKTAQTVIAQITILDLFGVVADDPVLRDYCVMLPHFSDSGAHKHLNEDGHHDRFAKIECDGVYIEKSFSDLQTTTKQKAYGEISEWGKRRRAFIATGDNRSLTWDRLGQHECWIKLGENSIEAVRQALLADEARISYEPPQVPSERIVALKVCSSLTNGETLLINFNSGFNAIIGGRGSGKSALLEYLRFGLGRTMRDLLPSNEEEAEQRYDRDAQLIEDTLGTDGFVEVDIERGGVVETWNRDLEDRDVIFIYDEDGEFVTKLTLQDAQRRFPARAFYQKGLSSTMNNATTAAEQITGIAAAEELEKRREIDASIDKAKREIATTLRQLSALWQINLERRRAKARTDDLKKRIAAIASKLEKEGVKKETLDVIASAPAYDRAANYLAQINRSSNADLGRLNAAKANLLNVSIKTFPEIGSFQELSELDKKVSTAKAKIIQQLDTAIAEIGTLNSAHASAVIAFNTRHAAYKEKLAAAVLAQSAHKQLLDERNRLGQELKEAEALELEIAEQELESKDAQKNFEKARADLSKLLSDRQRVLTAAARKVEGKSSNMLKAKFKSDPRPREYVEALVLFMEGARVHDAELKSEEWIESIVESSLMISWVDVCETILELYSAKIAVGSPSEPNEEALKKIKEFVFEDSTLTTLAATKFYQNIDDQSVAELLAAVPRDQIIMTYVDQGRDFEFEKASPGQQASALLELLLHQSAGTLIIDQPEDDLDNRIIMHIVKQIRTSKSGRQLVFATHNPNIVVNGDADKIIALSSGEPTPGEASDPRIQIDVDGAIETPEVRKAITQIMEGGKEAFDLRNRKYNFETIAD